MKYRKIIVAIALGIILTNTSFLAIANPNTITDQEDDVIKQTSSGIVTTDTRPEIDIKELQYEKKGKKVSLILKINEEGVIEDKNNITYMIQFNTSSYLYFIYYINKSCNITYMSSSLPLPSYIKPNKFNSEDSKLTIEFDLVAASEKINHDSFYIMASYGNKYIDNAPTLDVEAAASTYNAKVGEEIDFSAEVEDGNSPFYFEWDFGDENTSKEKNPSHSFNKEGTYNITLAVSDNKQYGFDSFQIEVTDNGSSTDGEDDEQDTDDDNNSDSSGSDLSGLLVFFALIAIVVIVGIAVLVYIIRK